MTRIREDGTAMWTLFAGALKLILLGISVLYGVQVLITLRTEGPNCQLKFDPRVPARSFERLLIWLGVRILSAVLTVLKATLDTLEDASADIGEWVLHRRNP